MRALGDEHPETLAAKGLAILLARQAVLPVLPLSTTLMARALAASQDGDEALVGVMRGLAAEIESRGPTLPAPATEEDVAEAERNLATCLRVLGDDHTETILARLALIQTYMFAQDDRYAEPSARLLVEMFSALGEEHPVTTLMFGMFKAMFTVAQEHAEGESANDEPRPPAP